MLFDTKGQMESLLLFMLLAATMLIPYFVYLEPLGAGMVTIKHEMCGGNQTFVVALNPEVQEVVGLTTKSGLYEEASTGQKSCEVKRWDDTEVYLEEFVCFVS